MANCPNGSQLKPGTPDSIIRIRQADAGIGNLPRWLQLFRPSPTSARWEVDLVDTLSPGQLSEYGTLYIGDLMSRFCRSPPPTSVPGYVPTLEQLIVRILGGLWNENCECIAPPLPTCCGVWGGRGQGQGYLYSYRVRGEYHIRGNPPGNTVVDFEDTTTGSLCATSVVDDATGTKLVIALDSGPGYPKSKSIIGVGSPGCDIFNIAVVGTSIVRVDGEPDRFCDRPQPPTYEEQLPPDYIRFGDRPPTRGSEFDVVVINLPAVPGEKGDKGDKGEPGINGLDGSQGLPGRDGTNGADGTMGLTGVKGDTGATGVKGDTGDRGERGAQGEPGIDGESGAPGEAIPPPTITLRNVVKVAVALASRFNLISATATEIVYDLVLSEDMQLIPTTVSVPRLLGGEVVFDPKTINVISDGTNDGGSAIQAELDADAAIIRAIIGETALYAPWTTLASGTVDLAAPVTISPLLNPLARFVRLLVVSVPDGATRTYRLAGEESEYGLGNMNFVVANTDGSRDLFGERVDVFTKSTLLPVPEAPGRLSVRISLRAGVQWVLQQRVSEF